MMNIEEKIKAIVSERLPSFSYVFENWYDADTAIDRTALPAVICILPVSGTLEKRNGRTKDTESLSIAFVNKVVRNADGNDNAEVYNKMKEAASIFIDGMNACGMFEPVERCVYRVICEKLASIVTGVMLELDIKELKGVC